MNFPRGTWRTIKINWREKWARVEATRKFAAARRRRREITDPSERALARRSTHRRSRSGRENNDRH